MDAINEKTFVVKFDDRSNNWSSDPDFNDLFLRTVHNFLADRLRIKRYLFLNEIFHELGLPWLSQGQLVGWMWNPEAPVIELWKRPNRETDGEFTLKFETQGVIYDKIESL